MIVGIKSNCIKNIMKYVFILFFYKGGSIIFFLMIVLFIIKFLDIENYGIWLILNLFIVWFLFFDIGLGNGLRNKFVEVKVKGDLILVKVYVSLVYFIIGFICLFLIIVFLVFNFFIDWIKIFNIIF